jgi:putative tricarboxylic transport membrane protein
MKNKFSNRLFASAALSLFAAAAFAQAYPSKPVKLIVPFAAGGPSDAHMRQVASAMAKQLKQPIIVENVAGGGGNIGPRRVAGMAPDGYTLMHGNTGLVTAPAMFKDLGFNPLTDFDCVGLVAFDPSVLMARGDFPATGNLKEFLAYVKANQSKLQIGAPAGPSQLSALLFQALTGTTLTTVPYQSAPQAMNDLLAGRIDLLSNSSIVVVPFIKSGKLKPIGIGGKFRIASLPDVPTLDEQGLTGYDTVVWTALFAPRHLPRPILERLSGALQDALSDPELVAYFTKLSSKVATREQATPAALEAVVKADYEKWGTVLRNAGIKPE